jgi:ATP-binding cassette subfamily B multidrug efflux pump
MDRLIVLEQGRIVEQGTHAQLLRLNGHYAMLWKHQSGGFLPHDMPRDVQYSVANDVTQEDSPVLEEGPVDDMRAAEQPEPNTNDEPMPTRA